MAKKFLVVGIGGNAQTFTSKRSYLKWAVSTRDGFKHLMMLPVFGLLWLRARKYRKELEEMRESRLSE